MRVGGAPEGAVSWVYDMTILRALGFALGLALGSAGVSYAATISSAGTCKVGDVFEAGNPANTSLACFGAVAGNDSEYNNSGANVGLNNNDFGFAEMGMFGISDWMQIGRQEDATGASGIFLDGIGDDATSGIMDFNFGTSLAAAETVLIVLKGGPQFAAYLFDAGDMPTSLDWSTSALLNNQGKAQGLSHLSVYTSDEVTAVPLPAMLPAFLLALGGLGYAARRRKASA